MRIHRIAAVAVVAALGLAAPATASPVRVERFDLAPYGSRTVQLPGSGHDVRVVEIRVNGRKLTTGYTYADLSFTMYGENAVVRISQRRRGGVVRAASVSAKTAHVTLRYVYGTP